MLQNNKNDYMLLKESIKDDGMSMTSTLVSNTNQIHSCKPYSSKQSIHERSSSINSLCRRISNSIKRNYDGIQSRRETRREKRPQDGKTNPME